MSESPNPKQALGQSKVPYSCIPATVEAEIGLGMYEGDRKHGRHNFRVVGSILASIYYDAARRHLSQWWEGEDYDPDSKANLSHVTKAITSLVVLRDAMITGRFEDDRPPALPDGWMNAMNEKVKLLNEAYPNRAHTYTQMEQAYDDWDGTGPGGA